MAKKISLFALLLLLAAPVGWAGVAKLDVEILEGTGKRLPDAVITLKGPIDRPSTDLAASMDQRNQQFAPHVLAVHTGSLIKFPNSDNIRHQVYSFSPAKRFELRLYEGTPSEPVLFDKPGVVVLGCNIHDRMLGYVFVTDDPFFAVSDAQGNVALDKLAVGEYHVTLWHPQLKGMQPIDAGTLKLPARGLQQHYTLTLEPLPEQTAPATSAFGDAFKRATRETAQ
ncbi:methylamine utilization protein [Pseudomonas brassicacearum]|uniref:Methylamine utilization protein n=1 Tax=Pseudomonas brassicacearum TaxID=930166 RepID=A0A423GAA2_9PSED|nr:methylamine utilization protein [Pseudomonas brassicacearum]ROM83290.1 methylamine utilization protein [Pseudomonas brassicacearum]